MMRSPSIVILETGDADELPTKENTCCTDGAVITTAGSAGEIGMPPTEYGLVSIARGVVTYVAMEWGGREGGEGSDHHISICSDSVEVQCAQHVAVEMAVCVVGAVY